MSSLTVEELRAQVETDLADADLQLLINAAEQAVARVAGPLGDVVEIRAGGSSIVILNRRAATISTIREAGQDEDLDPDDFWLRSDQRSIDRLETGPDPSSTWRGPVVVTYSPVDDVAERKAIAIKLVELDLSSTPGVLGFTEGNWSIQFPNGETWGATRADLLSAAAPLWTFG